MENLLIFLSIPVLWLLLLRKMKFAAFQGLWVDIAVGISAAVLVIIALRRLSLWAKMGWSHGNSTRNGRDDE